MPTRALLATAAAAAALALPAAAQAGPAPSAPASPAAADGPVAQAAHTTIVRRTPASGATARNVKTVSITFSQRLTTGKIEVWRGKTKLSPRRSGPNGATVKATFARKLAAGSYTVRWRAVASDGHLQTGSWSFRAR
jgi:methionine-rich copper-binding protein CopC